MGYGLGGGGGGGGGMKGKHSKLKEDTWQTMTDTLNS